MKVIATVVALAILASVTNTSAEASRPSEWDETCAIMQIDCTGIQKPIVIYTNLMGVWGLYGAYYHGEPFLFIDPDAPPETYVHELTHYLLWNLGLFRGGKADSCSSEELARRVAAIWAGEEYNDKWRLRYGCRIGRLIK